MPTRVTQYRRQGRSAALQIDDKALLDYCDNVKNITVSVDDETHRRARIKAAEQDTSVSALVKQFLVALASDEGTAQRLAQDLAQEEQALRARIRDFSAADRLSRDELHDRRR